MWGHTPTYPQFVASRKRMPPILKDCAKHLLVTNANIRYMPVIRVSQEVYDALDELRWSTRRISKSGVIDALIEAYGYELPEIEEDE